MRDLTTAEIGKLVSVTGVVTRTSEVRPELLQGTFKCLDCGTVVKNVEQQFKYTEVTSISLLEFLCILIYVNCLFGVGSIKSCSVANFYLISTESIFFPAAAFDAADNLCESHMYEAGAMGIASAREQIC